MNTVILESESDQNLELVLNLAKKLGVKSREVPAQHWQGQISASKNQAAGPIIETQASPLLVDSLRLVLDYMQVLRKIGCDDYVLSNEIFTKIIQTLLVQGVDTEKISVGGTEDDSLSVRGKVGDKSFYFETYFDEEEYQQGYEVISSVYFNKKNIAAVSGSIDFVLENIAEKISSISVN